MLAFARLTVPAAVALFLVAAVIAALVGDWAFVLLVPAGLLLASRGALMLARPEGVLRPLAEAEASGIGPALGLRREHRFGAILLIVIGIGWMAFGVGAAV